MAIITRWRMPPENSWGYWVTRVSGWGMDTMSSSSMARFVAASPFRPMCSFRTSSSWLPTVYSGFSEVMGSWKIMEISLPRILLKSLVFILRMSCPLNRILPVTRAVSGSRRMMELAVTDLPEPDSPTMPSVSPAFSLKLAWETACTTPDGVWNSTERSSTSRTYSEFLFAIFLRSLRLVYLRMRGSSASRSESPSTLKHSMISEIITAG